MPVLPLPGLLFRSLGRAVDLARKVAPFESIFTAEAMDLLTLARPTDDSLVHEELGITYRPVEQTIDDVVRGLYRNGIVTAAQVGKAAS
jgi:hypothetical protein